MQLITASEVKRNSSILQNAIKDDILVTKRDKPFVVILDYEKYLKLTAASCLTNNESWINETFAAMSENDADSLLQEINEGRLNKSMDNLWS